MRVCTDDAVVRDDIVIFAEHQAEDEVPDDEEVRSGADCVLPCVLRFTRHPDDGPSPAA